MEELGVESDGVGVVVDGRADWGSSAGGGYRFKNRNNRGGSDCASWIY